MNVMKAWLAVIVIAAVLLGLAWQVQASGSTVNYYKVSVDSLNVRNNPDKNGQVIASLSKGDVVAVSKEQNGWLKVAVSKTAGWVAGYYLVKTDSKSASVSTSSSGSASSSSKLKTVTADSLRMREGPGTSYGVVGSLVRGEAVTVLNNDSGWSKISTSNGQRGWVSSQYLGSGSSGSGSSSSSSSSGTLRGKVIILDPGHGGDDPGMIGKKLETLEKDLNLDTAELLADKLRAKGAQVIMTRTSDTKPSLAQRVKISENAGADAFVSIHYNSSTKNTSGTLTFYYGSKDKPLAQAIEAKLSDGGTGLKSNGYAFGDYHVLRENAQPAALVELGFLSNEKDEKTVRTSSYKQKAAAAIAEGLEDYFD